MQIISRSCTFDSAHRVMNEKFKCFNLHGHTFHCELQFEYDEADDIGYAIDFKEIKRVGLEWIDVMLDHGFIANPKDSNYIEASIRGNSKLWLMSLNGKDEYCNPSAENISKEIFLAMMLLFAPYYPNLKMYAVKLHETPNCYVMCTRESISELEFSNWHNCNYEAITAFRNEKGVLSYDDRNTQK